MWFDCTSVGNEISDSLVPYMKECTPLESRDTLERYFPSMEVLATIVSCCNRNDTRKWTEESRKIHFRDNYK